MRVGGSGNGQGPEEWGDRMGVCGVPAAPSEGSPLRDGGASAVLIGNVTGLISSSKLPKWGDPVSL